MTETWYPDPAVNQAQHERLMGGACASGVFGHPSDTPVVYAPGSGTREVRIRASRRAVVEGYGWENDASEIVLPSLAANATGSTRVDLVVLRLDRSDWSVKVKAVQGTAGAGAPAPTFTASGVWELPLAEVVVASGATTIAGSAVTNRAWYVGNDGQIRCTATTRPTHETGRVMWETTTGRQYVSNGSAWLTGVEDSGETTLPLASNWSAGVNVVHRRNGMVFVSLSPQRTGSNVAADAAIVVGTLPAGFRPATLIEGLIAVSTGDTGGRFSINAAGTVTAVFFGGLLTNRYANFQALTFPTA